MRTVGLFKRKYSSASRTLEVRISVWLAVAQPDVQAELFVELCFQVGFLLDLDACTVEEWQVGGLLFLWFSFEIVWHINNNVKVLNNPIFREIRICLLDLEVYFQLP